MEIGNKIKRLRLQLNLSQAELADRCELTKGYISQLENDLTSPSISTLMDILSALGTDLAEFFKKDDDTRVVFPKATLLKSTKNGIETQMDNSERSEKRDGAGIGRAFIRRVDFARFSSRRRGIRVRAGR